MSYKVYADRALVPAHSAYVPMLAPLWGIPPQDPHLPNASRYDQYFKIGPSYVIASPSLEQADVVVIPVDWSLIKTNPSLRSRVESMTQAAVALGKPVICFYWSDDTDPVPLPGVSVYRTSFYASTKQAHEAAMPSWSEDFLETYSAGTLTPCPWTATPSVGFCGMATWGWKDQTKLLWHRLRHGAKWALHNDPNIGRYYRIQALNRLAADSRLNTRFICHTQFFAGTQNAPGAAAQNARAQYVENMFQSDYVLCVRGFGNFSYRFYETLSAGRLPLFVNSDCVLPCDDVISWQDAFPWIEVEDLETISSQLYEWHTHHHGEAFHAKQQKIREIWEQWLAPEAFFKYLLHKEMTKNATGVSK
jgi:hypothetical protein